MLLRALCKTRLCAHVLLTKPMLRIMKLTAIIQLVVCLTASAAVNSQKLTIYKQNVPLDQVFKMIEDQTGYVFFYDYSQLKKAKNVSVHGKDVSLESVLKVCFKDQPLVYKVVDKTIVVKAKESNQANIMSAATFLPPPVINVSGIVYDENGNPLAGVAVKIKGAEKGVTTDRNGQFYVTQVASDASLVFSYVGYEVFEKALAGARSFVITLKPVINELNQTVVIGYGTTTKRKNTGSVASITAEEIAKQPVANPLNALQGRIAGAIVTQSNGLPGSRVTIQIRGNTSLDPTGSGNQPLYLVDGVPFNMYDNATPITNDLNSRGTSAAAGGLSPFSVINPADIERIDVLKDADATAIYGTRGGNGVVMITTKKGKVGKTKLALNIYQGAGKVGHFIPMMNTQQYLQMRKEAFANDNITPTSSNAPDLLTWDQNAYTDWQRKYMSGTASSTDAQATVSGGDQRTRFLLNAGFHRETPVFPGNFKDDRISGRMNVEHSSLDRKFNAVASINYAFNRSNLISRDLSTLYNLPPNMPIANASGAYTWFNSNVWNPEAVLRAKYFGKTNNLMTNTTLRYTVLPGLDIKTSFGFNKIQLNQNQQSPAEAKNILNGSIPVNHSASFVTTDQQSWILEPQITYATDISRGRLSALVGSTFQNSLNTTLTNTASAYTSPELLGALSGAGAYGTPGYAYTLYKYASLFGRLNYDWESKYFLNVVARRDGSTRFGDGKKFGNFWSVGAGWVFSKESFAQFWNFLSFGKLRASYGITGNDQITDYGFRAFYVSNNSYQGGPATALDKIENSNLHWQTTKKLEFGVDLGFINDRIQVTANYYRNRTPNQLGYLSISEQTGFNSYIANFDAVIGNTGFELELNGAIFAKKDFKWNAALNLTVPRTKLIAASPLYFYYNKSALGQPLSTQFKYNYLGVDPATGVARFVNQSDKSATTTPDYNRDRIPSLFTAPKLYGGINNTFTYKQLELSFFFHYSNQDGNIAPASFAGDLASGNQTTYYLNRWTKAGDNAPLPRASSNTSLNSNFVYTSDAFLGHNPFLRLRTVNLSYTLPAAITGKMKIENLRVYLQGQNLWWTAKNKYVFDPESGTAMPPLRLITAGINVTF